MQSNRNSHRKLTHHVHSLVSNALVTHLGQIVVLLAPSSPNSIAERVVHHVVCGACALLAFGAAEKRDDDRSSHASRTFALWPRCGGVQLCPNSRHKLIPQRPQIRTQISPSCSYNFDRTLVRRSPHHSSNTHCVLARTHCANPITVTTSRSAFVNTPSRQPHQCHSHCARSATGHYTLNVHDVETHVQPIDTVFLFRRSSVPGFRFFYLSCPLLIILCG